VNAAYKHLDAKLRIVSLTLAQWCAVVCGFALAVGWGEYIHPLSGTLNTVTAVYLGGIPVLVAWAASEGEVSLGLHLRALVRWRRGGDRYVPGPSQHVHGYVVAATVTQGLTGRSDRVLDNLDPAMLWD
jgi:hypothetical protein